MYRSIFRLVALRVPIDSSGRKLISDSRCPSFLVPFLRAATTKWRHLPSYLGQLPRGHIHSLLDRCVSYFSRRVAPRHSKFNQSRRKSRVAGGRQQQRRQQTSRFAHRAETALYRPIRTGPIFHCDRSAANCVRRVISNSPRRRNWTL